MSITDQLEDERRIINAATAGPMWMSNPHGPSEIFQGEGSGSDLMCAEFYRPADAQLFLHARTALPLRNAQVEAVLAIHEELVVYQMEDLETREFMTDENGEEIVLARVCRECSSEEVVDSIEDCEYQDGIYGEESYPCATVRAIEEAVG